MSKRMCERSPTPRRSKTHTPDDNMCGGDTGFNSNQFWCSPVATLNNVCEKKIINVTSAGEKMVNNNDKDSINSNITTNGITDESSSKTKKDPSQQMESTSASKTIKVPTNFNSLNELTDEELMYLIEERKKAAAAALTSDPILRCINQSKCINNESDNFESTNKTTRRVSETNSKVQEAPLDLRRKSLPVTKNILQGFLQNFIISANKKQETCKEVVKEGVPDILNGIEENVLDEYNAATQSVLDADEEVKMLNSTMNNLQVTDSPVEELKQNNDSSDSVTSPCIELDSCELNESSSAECNITTSPKPVKGCVVSVCSESPRRSSPELICSIDTDFGCVTPIPQHEFFSSTMNFNSDSPLLVSRHSPILSCSFNDPMYNQYSSDLSDMEGESSSLEPDLISFEDPALEKSPFIKYSVELRAKLAVRNSAVERKPSPFLFSPRTTSSQKVYSPANDRNLHLLKEETTDLEESGDLEEITASTEEELTEIDQLVEELNMVQEIGEIEETSIDVSKKQSDENYSDVSSTSLKESQISQTSLSESDSIKVKVIKKSVWAQLVENIESHIIRGNEAGFIPVLISHPSSNCISAN